MRSWPFAIPLAPMEPVIQRHPFDSPDYGFQVKWDGIRCLAYLSEAKVQLFNRRLRERTRQYPELEVLKEIPADYTIFDGEIIAVMGKVPDFPTVIRRDRAIKPDVIEFLRRTVPICYMVFDLLCLNGKSLLQTPMEDRYTKLTRLLPGSFPVIPVDTVWENGRALFKACRENNLEGMVAKLRSAPYLPGAKAPSWQKVKSVRRHHFTVGGMIVKDSAVSSIYLGLEEKDRLRYVGRASAGIDRHIARRLLEIVIQYRVPDCPFDDCPREKHDGIYWVRPVLKVLVEFMEWTEELKLRHPRIVNFLSGWPLT